MRQTGKITIILAVVLIVIFALCAGLSGVVSAQNDTQNQNNQSIIVPGNQNSAGNNSNAGNLNTNTGNGSNSNTNNNQNNNINNAPTVTPPQTEAERKAFALNLVVQSIAQFNLVSSYTFTTTQEIITPTSTQNLKTYGYKQNAREYLKTYAETTTIFGSNYYKDQDLNGGVLTSRVSTDFKFDEYVNFKNAKTLTQSESSFRANNDNYGLLETQLNINASTADVISYEERGDVYIVNLYFNPNAVTNAYKQVYVDTDLINNIEFKSMLFTYTIDKKTMQMVSLTKQEKFEGNLTFLGIWWGCEAKTTQIFSNYNDTFLIDKL